MFSFWMVKFDFRLAAICSNVSQNKMIDSFNLDAAIMWVSKSNILTWQSITKWGSTQKLIIFEFYVIQWSQLCRGIPSNIKFHRCALFTWKNVFTFFSISLVQMNVYLWYSTDGILLSFCSPLSNQLKPKAIYCDRYKPTNQPDREKEIEWREKAFHWLGHGEQEKAKNNQWL